MARSVLIVDDEADSRGGMAEALRGAGYVVVEAANGREALEHLLSGVAEEPALIVLDLAMPVMSGWELLAITKSYYRLSNIPVLVISGKDSPTEAMRHGVITNFVAKPFEPGAFVSLVAKAARAPASAPRV